MASGWDVALPPNHKASISQGLEKKVEEILETFVQTYLQTMYKRPDQVQKLAKMSLAGFPRGQASQGCKGYLRVSVHGVRTRRAGCGL